MRRKIILLIVLVVAGLGIGAAQMSPFGLLGIANHWTAKQTFDAGIQSATLSDGTTTKTVTELATSIAGGSGVTTIDTDGASAVATFAGEATRIGIAGTAGVTTYGSGNTVYISGGAFARTNTDASFTSVTTPNIEAGNSPYAINGNTVFTTANLNRFYTLRLTASPIVQIPTPSVAGNRLTFIDRTVAGYDSGMTVFCNGASIWQGTGSSATAGTTKFWNTGSTGFVVQLYARDASTWVVVPTDVTVISKP